MELSKSMPGKLKILLIEDDRDDVEFLKVALDDNRVHYSMETLMRGDLVPKWLSDQHERPDIFIMDLNLPKMHGREVICKIKEHPDFRTVPLIVLTTSSLPEDIEYCMRNGADKFISKPSTTEGFTVLVKDILETAALKKH